MYYPSQTQSQPRYNPVAIPPYPQQNAPSTNLFWVQGIESVKAQNVPIGGKMVFFDSEESLIYIKSVDDTGKPEITVLEYTQRVEEPKTQSAQSLDYVTKDQLDTLNQQFSSINDKLSGLDQFVTKDQFDGITVGINNLNNQIKDIEDRILNFGKPVQNNRKGNNNGKSSV